MDCHCNTYNEFEMQFLDINGLTYLLSMLNMVMDRKIENRVALIPACSCDGSGTVSADDLATNEDIDNIFTTQTNPSPSFNPNEYQEGIIQGGRA